MFNKISEQPKLVLENTYTYSTRPMHIYNDLVYVEDRMGDKLNIYREEKLIHSFPRYDHLYQYRFNKNYMHVYEGMDYVKYEITEQNSHIISHSPYQYRSFLFFDTFHVQRRGFCGAAIADYENRELYVIPKNSDKYHCGGAQSINNNQDLGLVYEKRLLLYDSTRNKLRHLVTIPTECLHFDYLPELYQISTLDLPYNLCLWDERFTKLPVICIPEVKSSSGFVEGQLSYVDKERNFILGSNVIPNMGRGCRVYSTGNSGVYILQFKIGRNPANICKLVQKLKYKN